MFSPSAQLTLRVTINNKNVCPIVGYTEFEDGSVEALYMDASGSIHSLDELLPETTIVVEFKAADGVWNKVV